MLRNFLHMGSTALQVCAHGPGLCSVRESSAGRLTADVAPDRCWHVRRFYMMSPKHCHAFVGYLEEEAVKTCMPCAQNPAAWNMYQSSK